MFIRRALLVAVGLLVLLAPASARASAVAVNGSTLSFAAVDGEANDVTVTFAPGTYTITDAGAAVSAGTCTQVNPATVSCPSAGITALSLDGRDRDDRIVVTGASVATTLIGAEGDDALLGADGTDTLNGGAGADRLDGGVGNDTLNGDSGEDRLIGGAGNDTLQRRHGHRHRRLLRAQRQPHGLPGRHGQRRGAR